MRKYGKTNYIVTVGENLQKYRCHLSQSIGYIQLLLQKQDPKQIYL
jgi:hypothetical protein